MSRTLASRRSNKGTSSDAQRPQGSASPYKLFVWGATRSSDGPNHDKINAIAVTEYQPPDRQWPPSRRPSTLSIPSSSSAITPSSSSSTVLSESFNFVTAWHSIYRFVSERCRSGKSSQSPLLVSPILQRDASYLRSELEKAGIPLPPWRFACIRLLVASLYPGLVTAEESRDLPTLTQRLGVAAGRLRHADSGGIILVILARIQEMLVEEGRSASVGELLWQNSDTLGQFHTPSSESSGPTEESPSSPRRVVSFAPSSNSVQQEPSTQGMESTAAVRNGASPAPTRGSASTASNQGGVSMTSAPGGASTSSPQGGASIASAHRNASVRLPHCLVSIPSTSSSVPTISAPTGTSTPAAPAQMPIPSSLEEVLAPTTSEETSTPSIRGRRTLGRGGISTATRGRRTSVGRARRRAPTAPPAPIQDEQPDSHLSISSTPISEEDGPFYTTRHARRYHLNRNCRLLRTSRSVISTLTIPSCQELCPLCFGPGPAEPSPSQLPHAVDPSRVPTRRRRTAVDRLSSPSTSTTTQASTALYITIQTGKLYHADENCSYLRWAKSKIGIASAPRDKQPCPRCLRVGGRKGEPPNEEEAIARGSLLATYGSTFFKTWAGCKFHIDRNCRHIRARQTLSCSLELDSKDPCKTCAWDLYNDWAAAGFARV